MLMHLRCQQLWFKLALYASLFKLKEFCLLISDVF